MKNGYIAFVLDTSSRTNILKNFPPIHPNIIAHHITLTFGVSQPDDSMINAFNSAITDIKVVCYVADDKAEALIVMINHTMVREDGKYFHLTLSIDRSKGVKPVYSNKLIANNTNVTIHPAIPITGKVEFIPF